MAGCRCNKDLSSLISKLEDLPNTDLSTAVTDIAEKANDGIIASASVNFPDNASKSRLVKKVQYSPSNISIQVGYKGSFDSWKHMYFHNYGYHQYVYGNPTGHMTTCHIHWFDTSAQKITNELGKELKEKISREYRNKLNNI